MAWMSDAAPTALRSSDSSKPPVLAGSPPANWAAVRKNCLQDSSTEAGSRTNDSYISAMYPSLKALTVGRFGIALKCNRMDRGDRRSTFQRPTLAFHYALRMTDRDPGKPTRRRQPASSVVIPVAGQAPRPEVASVTGFFFTVFG